MSTHRLKTWPVPFQDMWMGRKPWEFRRDDRKPRFMPGDELVLYEYNPWNETESGRRMRGVVAHVVRGPDFGIPDGFAILTVENLIRFESPASAHEAPLRGRIPGDIAAKEHSPSGPAREPG